MAARTRLWRTLEDIVGMTFGTGRVDMRAGKRKRRLAVIERCLRPVFRRVTTGAIVAELTLVFVVLQVARHAARRRALVHLIRVTGFALGGRVLSK